MALWWWWWKIVALLIMKVAHPWLRLTMLSGNWALDCFLVHPPFTTSIMTSCHLPRAVYCCKNHFCSISRVHRPPSGENNRTEQPTFTKRPSSGGRHGSSEMQLTTRHLGVRQIPGSVTHGSPFPVKVDLHPALEACLWARQPNIPLFWRPFWACCCTKITEFVFERKQISTKHFTFDNKLIKQTASLTGWAATCV